MSVRKVKGPRGGIRYQAVAHRTGRVMGTYRSRAAAQRRLAQGHMFSSLKRSGKLRKR